MHGCNSGSALLVNAEVDSMGGVVDGGVGIGLKTSPRRAAIEKSQAELRQEYDVREERRKELEFLEKGGNPLDFKFGNAASVSVQSTSLADQHHEQLVTSEAKGSFVALTASPHGDSVDSSARPGAPSLSEPNTADNLLLFDGANDLPEGEKKSLHSNKRNNLVPSEQSSQIGGTQIAKETEDSAIFRPYARRNRSRPNHGPRGGSRDGKGLLSDTNKQKEHNVPSVSKPKPASLNGEILTKDLTSNNNPLDNELIGVRAHQTTSGSASVPEDKLDITINRNFKDNQHIIPSQDDALQNPVVMASGDANVVEAKDPGASADHEPSPFVATTQPGNESCSGLPNGFGNIKVDKKGVPNEGRNSSGALGMKNFDLESCAQTSLARDVNKDSDLYTNSKNVEANGNTMELTSEFEMKSNSIGCEVVKERNKINASESGDTVTNEHVAGYQNYCGGSNVVKSDNDIHINGSCLQNKANNSSNIKGVHHNYGIISKAYKGESAVLVDHFSSIKENSCERHQVPMDVSVSESPQTASPEQVTTVRSSCQPCSTHLFKQADRAHEDSILEEARIIEVKRKRIAELSIHMLPPQNYQKSHWGFVLEEMAWLANDFAQERLWKMAAAAHLCHCASFTSRLRLEKQNKQHGLKTLSHSMSKAVMQFWHSVELLLDNDDPDHNCNGGSVESGKADSNEASEGKRRDSDMDKNKHLEGQNSGKKAARKVRAYALRFLKDSRSCGISSQAEAPTTPDKILDLGTVDMSWEDHLTEESLFYTVPPSAMESYRKSIESHFLQFEKTGSSIQEEVETSMYDTAADFESEGIAYDEDEGETGTYCLPGVSEGSRPSKSVQKKHKNRMMSYTHRSSEVGTDLPYVHYSTGTQPSLQLGKRPGLHVGAIPTKRMRTASRQRVVSPFTVVSGTVQGQAKTDASSGDTNSFQDDQSTLQVGSQILKSVEVESVGDFEKHLPYDCAETSVKAKKKKPKNSGSAYDQGWHLDSVVLNEQRDHSKKRLDSHHFESNGSSGFCGQHNAKKPKTMKHSLDNNFDNITPITNSIPSPAASQMSNMSNPSKFIRIISGGRDRGRKAKALKVSAGQPGSGSPWSLFEDQALVVLVHDMGPNWELVSDAINSTLQFKCIFRKPKECKERHKILMDRSAGDGADSAEDSGSSQSYPSTLPGIPKGSARQLFQRLQGPMEEDTLKSHFDKIIKIGHKHHYRRNQNDNQDLKQLAPVHNSHMNALSGVFPNNSSGGVLTPLDLCDTNATSPDVLSIGYQGSHTGGLPLSNHGSIPSALPTSGLNSSITPSGMSLGNSLSLPSGPLATSVRDSRYGVPRTSPLSVDEQQKIQQYNQMISGRNMQQSSVSVPGPLSGSDRGVRILPGGNGMGMMGGINRSVTMPRPGFQGMGSSSMLSSGGMISSSMVGMPSPVNVHSGVSTGQGNSVLRPREPLHMMRPGHNQEHQRQMMAPELPMQVSQGNSQGVPAFNGMSSAFNNQTNPPAVQLYTGHTQQTHQLSQQQSHLGNRHPHLQGPNHTTNSQQQAYAMRLAKERHIQQQRYLQQQQQFATSSALIPHAQSQSQLPISSSPLQNSPQLQPQNSSHQGSPRPVTPSSPLTPMSSQHQQQKHHLLQHGFSRNPGAGGLTNPAVKQRQRQPQQRQYQQSGRQHPNQPQHVQSQQQAKLLKGIGRGNMAVHQNHSVDPSHVNGLSVSPGSQTVEKGDQTMHMVQGQNLYPGSSLNPNPPSKPSGPAHSSNHSHMKQKLQTGPSNNSSKQLQPMVSPDSSIQGQVSPVPSGHITSPAQPTVIASNQHQLQLQSQPQSKQINKSHLNVHRMLQQNCQVHSESSSMSQSSSPKVDQQPANIASQASSSTAMSQGCMDSTSVATVVPTVPAQYKRSESPYDSSMPNPVTQVSSLGSTPVENSAGNEPTVISQGLGPRQIAASLSTHAHTSGGQWQQQSLTLQQQSSSQPILSQQPYQPPEHWYQRQQQEKGQHSPKDVALQPQPQQQESQHLQPGQGSVLIRSPNSEVE